MNEEVWDADESALFWGKKNSFGIKAEHRHKGTEFQRRFQEW